MSRITETRFGDRLVIVEVSSGRVYDIAVQAESDAGNVTSTVFTSQCPESTMAAFAAIAKTLELLHRVGDQLEQPLPFEGDGGPMSRTFDYEKERDQ